MKTVRARIEGRVQGVSFRYYTRHEALQLSLTGWVKNMSDGAVEAVFQGSDGDIEKMLSWLDIGSPHANVGKVVVKQLENDKTYPDFQIVL
ncbi:MAG: acylphosphatase [Desulfopila sp.]|jgi:acylphosphatase|nr:acylphosphatase [Desulfopila sp.]